MALLTKDEKERTELLEFWLDFLRPGKASTCVERDRANFLAGCNRTGPGSVLTARGYAMYSWQWESVEGWHDVQRLDEQFSLEVLRGRYSDARRTFVRVARIVAAPHTRTTVCTRIG